MGKLLLNDYANVGFLFLTCIISLQSIQGGKLQKNSVVLK